MVQTLRNANRAGSPRPRLPFSSVREAQAKTSTARDSRQGPQLYRRVRKIDFDPEEDICREIAEGISLDVLEIDGASNNSVDQIRELRDAVKFTPARGQYKIYYIDEVHMLTNQAFNALLKTLEEPPEHVKFHFRYDRAEQDSSHHPQSMPTLRPQAYLQSGDRRPPPPYRVGRIHPSRRSRRPCRRQGRRRRDARLPSPMLDQLVAFLRGATSRKKNVLDIFGFKLLGGGSRICWTS